MDLGHREILYLERAKNELDLAKAIFKLSTDNKLKLEFELKEDSTFFSNVIGNAYYCIFYSAKAFLKFKDIITKLPEEHKKTFNAFKNLVDSGFVDKNLFEIYEQEFIKADELLGIFRKEKSKRGKFTYRKLPQANLEPAKESLENAETFFKNINLMLQKLREKARESVGKKSEKN